MKRALPLLLAIVVVALIAGTMRDPDFWRTSEQRGDGLFREGKFAEAAKTYRDPWRIGLAQYRNGDYEDAAKTFARVPGASGAFDQGNAWLMHGKYDAAIASYDRALGFRAGWKMAEENKALAQARKAKMEASGTDRADEQTGQKNKPDDVVFDQKGDDQRAPPVELAGGEMSDDEVRATWLRRVQTTPADFLRAKFAYQAAHLARPNPAGGSK